MAWSCPLQISQSKQVGQTEGTEDVLHDIVQNIFPNVLPILEKHSFRYSL